MDQSPTPPAGTPRTILIDPVTRIEGHAKITIHLDASGSVAAARFHVTEFRGFEAFCAGRPFTEMPALTARICGICPVSHLLASAKAGDQLLAVTIPPAAERLRRLMNLAQIIQSHALSFFHLSSPDFLLGWDCDPARRNVFGLIAADPELARGGIRLRQFGQTVIERLGGRKIHPAWAVAGGVRTPSPPPTATRSVRGCLRLSPPPARPWRCSNTCWMGWRRRPLCSGTFLLFLWRWWGKAARGSTTAAACA